MRRIGWTMLWPLLFALLHTSTGSIAWGQERDLVAEQRAISAIKRIGGIVDRYEGSGTRGLSVRFDVLPPSPPGSFPPRRPDPINAELKHLKSVPHLKDLSLYVDWHRISGAGLEHVRGLKELESLDIIFFPLFIPRAKGDEPPSSGLKYIRDLGQLKSLHISLTNVSGTELRDIKDLPRLKSLSLMGHEITDADLDFLRGLKSLEYLSLSSPRITDEALVQVKGLTHLKNLDLSSCPRVAEKGVEELKRALPEIGIVRARG